MSIPSVVEPRLGLRGRIPSLDGLRGLAALSVLFTHSLNIAFPPVKAIYEGNEPVETAGSVFWWLTHTPLHVPWLGGEAVYTFFILSGLVLTRPVLVSTSFNWLSYYPKRMLRLYLPVWGSLIVVVTLTLVVAAASIPTAQVWADSHAERFTAANLIRDAIVIKGLTPISGVLWSLRWEILFSLLLPFYAMFAMTKRIPWYVKVLGVFVTATLGRTALVNNALFGEAFFYMSMFGLGAIMAGEFGRLELLAARISTSVHSSTWWAAIVGATAFILCAYWVALAFSPSTVTLEAARVLSFLGCGLLVFVASFNLKARQLLEMRPVQWLGLISFSLYLVHAVVLEATEAVLPEGLDYLVLAAGIPLSLLLAAVFHRYIEVPSSALAKRMEFGRRRPTSPV